MAKDNFRHTSILLGKYEPYLWPVVVIWCFDRFVRLVRLVCCNAYLQSNRDGILTTSSTISYSKATDIIRLEIIPGSPMARPEPGQHYYLYQPLKWRGYENHPFTLGSWAVVDNETGTEYYNASKVNELSVSASSSSSILKESESNKLRFSYKFIFFIRPFDGWTRRLRDECSKSPDRAINIADFLIEGPYGIRAPVENYENVIFIAGGTGIAVALPYIQDLVHRSISASYSREYHGHSSPAASSSSTALPSPGVEEVPLSTPFLPSSERTPPRTRKVTLIWSARQAAFIHDLASRELRPILKHPNGELAVDARFYSTESDRAPPTVHQQQSSDDVKNPTENTRLLSPKDLSDDAHIAVDIEHGRPDIRKCILNAVRDDCDRTAVVVCGPAGMADEARVAVHHALKGGARGVEYFEETFGW